MAPNALEIKNLRKAYDSPPRPLWGRGRQAGTVAVDGISFNIKKGEFFGFLGPNGAGKTTTIQCITGISRFKEGVITLFGIDVVLDYREARKMVGLSPQEYNVDIFMTARQIIEWMGGLYGMRAHERKERTEELIERFNLSEHADKKFQNLSGGLKRRVMLARAMVHDPDMLILDEPTAGVDVELRHELWGFLRDLNAEGKTILLTSHYLEEVQQLASRVAIINRGKIAALDTTVALTQNGDSLEKTYLAITRNNNAK